MHSYAAILYFKLQSNLITTTFCKYSSSNYVLVTNRAEECLLDGDSEVRVEDGVDHGVERGAGEGQPLHAHQHARARGRAVRGECLQLET